MSTDLIGAAYDEGRYDEALRLILEAFELAASGEGEPELDFIVTYKWHLMLNDGYVPAREAMIRVRDAQRARLLTGELTFGASDQVWPRSRFQVVLNMNQKLNDSRSSYDTFKQLLDIAPDVARRSAFSVVPAMVEVGDYTLAESYLGDPLADLGRLNDLAREFPLYPPRGQAPRLWAELFNFVRSVTLLMAVRRSRGREPEALALHTAALAGLESEALRTLAQREMAEPGLMNREIGNYLAESET
ncbi:MULTISPECIES: hypothetical protein [unclassified Duganella]|uniref:hypothetical protein n=1 Tax=unclassified Duganella TaxID=2636909 RepID=UPI00087FE262|nr:MULTISPECIES: hypothetical protein [unclassified Duganella]SDG50431.1 hypothetical protein SAMN05216320_1057 [Duganella sp. OV458]SDJ73113.1 hypothetical protein SAMN05428973_1067 [Duganella sp. OV510]